MSLGFMAHYTLPLNTPHPQDPSPTSGPPPPVLRNRFSNIAQYPSFSLLISQLHHLRQDRRTTMTTFAFFTRSIRLGPMPSDPSSPIPRVTPTLRAGDLVVSTEETPLHEWSLQDFRGNRQRMPISLPLVSAHLPRKIRIRVAAEKNRKRGISPSTHLSFSISLSKSLRRFLPNLSGRKMRSRTRTLMREGAYRYQFAIVNFLTFF